MNLKPQQLRNELIIIIKKSKGAAYPIHEMDEAIYQALKGVAEDAYLEGYSLMPEYDRSDFGEYWNSIN